MTVLIAKIKEAYKKKFDTCQQIVNIVTDYFGEDRVDSDLNMELPDEAFVFDRNWLGRFQDLSHLYMFNDDIYDDWVSLCDAAEEQNNPEMLKNYAMSMLLKYFEIEDEEHVIDTTEFNESYINSRSKRLFTIDDSEDNNFSIYVYFPSVTITNEHGDSHTITKVFIKILVQYTGLYDVYGSIQLARSEYTMSEFIAGYCHSHRRSVYSCNFEFADCCLGNGPIRGTINVLRREFDYDTWGMFCYELEKYVAVESLSGGPYIRMTSIKESHKVERNIDELFNMFTFSQTLNTIIDKFIRYFINNHEFKVAFSDNKFILGEDANMFRIKLSNYFIDWINEGIRERLIPTGIKRQIRQLFTDEFVSNGHFYLGNHGNYVNAAENESNWPPLLTFKGQEIKVHIIRDYDSDSMCMSKLITWNTYIYITNKIFTIINNEYGRETSDNRTKICI